MMEPGTVDSMEAGKLGAHHIATCQVLPVQNAIAQSAPEHV